MMAHLFEVCHFFVMWCPSQDTFEGLDLGAAFVAFRWHELFDQYSPDSYHAKLYSLSGLISEAVEIAELQKNQDAWGKHLILVKAEIDERVKTGIESQFCSARHLGMLNKISSSDTPSEIIRLGRVLELEGFSGKLEASMRKEFRQLDFDSVPSKKKKADQLLTTLGTYAFRRGCNSNDCANISVVLEGGAENTRSWVLGSLEGNESEFDCVVVVDAKDEKTIGSIRAVCERAGICRTGRLPGLPAGKSLVVFRRKTMGLRAIDAAEKLRAEIRSNLNVLSLYRQSSDPVILSEMWIVEKDEIVRIQAYLPSLQNLHPRRDASKLSANVATSLEQRLSAGAFHESEVRSALDLNNLALSMHDHRLRLINIWSALECLASLVDGKSIIDRVVKLVVPILTWRKIDKVVRYLSISIHYWLKKNPGIDRSSLPFKVGYKDAVHPEQILKLLCEPKDSVGIRGLLALVGKHPLLLYRVHRAWEIFHDPVQLQRDLERSSQRLTWHLWRIYRARNLLVHQGVEHDCLPQLSNHLQQYFSWTLSRILHGLTLGDQWTARDSWYYWKSKSDHVVESLGRNPKSLLMEDMFPEDLSHPEAVVWPNS
jgi:hypothetical protein